MISNINYNIGFYTKYNHNICHKSVPIHNDNKSSLITDYLEKKAIYSKSSINFKNTEIPIIIPLNKVANKSINGTNIDTNYIYNTKSPKDNYTALYTTMLIIFLTPPYHNENSTISNKNNINYLDLNFDAKTDQLSTYWDCYNKQQELIKAVFKTDIENTLNSIKKYDINQLQEDFTSGKISAQEKENTKRIINSITQDDIKEFMQKYLLEKEPMIKIN